MPFVLLAIGLMLIVVGVRNNQDAFYTQVQKDFFGQNNFTTWAIAVVALGSLGYVKAIKTPVDLFLGLIILGFLLSPKNVTAFENLLPDIQAAFSGVSPSAGNGGGTSGSSPAAGAAASVLNNVTSSLTSEVTNLTQEFA